MITDRVIGTEIESGANVAQGTPGENRHRHIFLQYLQAQAHRRGQMRIIWLRDDRCERAVEIEYAQDARAHDGVQARRSLG